MSHGAPDDSNVVNVVDLHRVDDMAELAARMGSIVNYIRSGKVLFMEGFEEGVGSWLTYEVGTNALIALTDERALTGGVALYLNGGTGNNPYSFITKKVPIVSEGKVGLAVAFSIISTGYHYEFRVHYGDGDKRYAFYIQYRFNEGKLYYSHVWEGYKEFASPGQLFHSEGNLHILKMVVNLVDKKFVRLHLDDVEYSMVGLTPVIEDTIYQPYLSVTIKVTGNEETANELYLDNVVLTFDEF